MSTDESHAWDWVQDAGDVVVRSQPGIAVYPGPAGVVIRAQGDLYGDGDEVIWFCVHQAPVIAAAILEAAGLDATALTPEPTQGDGKPMASTSAARQKRYRERKKKEPALFEGDESDVTRDVTDRDGQDA